MSSTQDDTMKKLSSFFHSSYLNDKKIKKIDKLLQLKIEAYNFLDEVNIELIKKIFNITKVLGFNNLNLEDPFELVNENGITTKDLEDLIEANPNFQEVVRKAIVVSNLLNRFNEKKLSIEKIEQKVLVMGLDNAGKSAILTTFGKTMGIDDLINLQPTLFVDRKEITTDKLKLLIWDFGGQASYRNQYLSEPEKFLGSNLLIYVIDIQDFNKFEESFQYLEAILDLLSKFEENPYVMILLHKFDPDLYNDPEMLLNLELADNSISALLKTKNFEYEIKVSSIISKISKEPKFSKYLKNIMMENKVLEDPDMIKIKEAKSIAESTMQTVLMLSESIKQMNEQLKSKISKISDKLSKNYYDLKSRMENIEKIDSIRLSLKSIKENEAKRKNELKLTPPNSLPPTQVIQKGKRDPQELLRSSIIAELKELFK